MQHSSFTYFICGEIGTCHKQINKTAPFLPQPPPWDDWGSLDQIVLQTEQGHIYSEWAQLSSKRCCRQGQNVWSLNISPLSSSRLVVHQMSCWYVSNVGTKITPSTTKAKISLLMERNLKIENWKFVDMSKPNPCLDGIEINVKNTITHLSASSKIIILCRPGGRVTFFWANILILFLTTSIPLKRIC